MSSEHIFSIITDERQAQWSAHEESAISEADRLMSALEKRATARSENAAAIRAKLKTGITHRQQQVLFRELGFLTTYEDHHPTGLKAINKHIWIKFGLNYNTVMQLRSLRS